MKGWIAWLNGNRHRVDADTIARLDRLLGDLEQEVVPEKGRETASEQFDAWLDGVFQRRDTPVD